MTRDNSLSLTMQAYNTLKERIMMLQLRPGELILVQPLAKDLGISRTPVREALVRLEREGFIEEAEGKKFKVSEITIKSILEIHEIRELIELHAVAKAADSCNARQLQKLKQLAMRMENSFKNNDNAEFFRTDMDFHAQILAVSDNTTLEQLMMQLNEKIQRIRHLTTYVYRRLEDTIVEHNAILSSIEDRNPDAAQQAMKRHLDNVKKGVVKLFDEGAMNLFVGVSLNP